MLREKIRITVRVIAFCLTAVFLITLAGNIFQPYWSRWNNFYTQNGFYEEPRNTLETVFVGPSTMLSAVNSSLLYEEFGICSYNLASEQQPMLASYYWTMEAWRLHKGSLKNVILCVSELRGEAGESAIRKGLDNLKLSDIKFRAFYNAFDGDLEKTLTEGLFKLGNYHSRWSELTEDDFNKLSFDKVNGTRGYYFTPTVWIGKNAEIETKNVVLDEAAEPAELVEESVLYFEKLVGFCKDKGINLVLIKTPAANWDSSLHNATAQLADKHELSFYDFNFGTLYDELNIIDIFDCADKGTHLNYYGACKFTRCMGQFLTEKCGASDVRGNKKYSYLGDQLQKFNDVFSRQITLQTKTDVADYITCAAYENSTVFITVKDAASKSFTLTQREKVKLLGLDKLSEIKSTDSYIGIIENGRVIYEEIKDGSDTSDKNSITYSGYTSDGTPYSLESGGNNHGNISSCIIDGEENSKNYRGINIVVYDNSYGRIIDSGRFDTYLTDKRTTYNPESVDIIKSGEIPENLSDDTYFSMTLERYNLIEEARAAEAQRITIRNNYLFRFLGQYEGRENTLIVLAAKDEISEALTDENRQLLSEYGLSRLSDIGFRESYIAVIRNGEIIFEDSGTADETLTYEENGVFVKSSGFNAENAVSVMIDNEEHSTGKRGINVVVYDTAENTVLESVFFDTYSSPIRTTENIF